MKIDYTDPDTFAVIRCDTPEESSLIRLALDRIASGMTHVGSASNRRAARDAYEVLIGGIDGPTDDFYRSTECTGGQWCRCPVTSPCPQRGTSHVTGFVADTAGVHRLTDARG